MSGTRIETVAMAESSAEAGDELPLTVAEPEGDPRGGLVVLHEARGVTDDVDGVLEVLSGQGWLAVAPHLYHRHGLTGVDPDPAEQAASLTGAGVLADCDTAFRWLAERGQAADRIGVLGFDIGGTVAFVVAASREVGAAVSVSPTGVASAVSEEIPSLVDAAPSLASPWLGLFGESDDTVPADEVEALREALRAADVATNLVSYPGVGHRFDALAELGDDAAELADAGATPGDAVNRVLGWFEANLR